MTFYYDGIASDVSMTCTMVVNFDQSDCSIPG